MRALDKVWKRVSRQMCKISHPVPSLLYWFTLHFLSVVLRPCPLPLFLFGISSPGSLRPSPGSLRHPPCPESFASCSPPGVSLSLSGILHHLGKQAAPNSVVTRPRSLDIVYIVFMQTNVTYPIKYYYFLNISCFLWVVCLVALDLVI